MDSLFFLRFTCADLPNDRARKSAEEPGKPVANFPADLADRDR